MCGIFGFLLNNKRELNDQKILESLSRRGPDYQNVASFAFTSEKRLKLLHTRLSIIDTSSAANQPIIDDLTGNSIVFNGEIYNYKQLLEELKSFGLTFKTNSDTEVILKGYQIWGISVFNKLRGMFALGIYDKANHKLILARDTFGIKPLYYYYENNELVFSSLLQSIVDSGIKQKFNLNKESILDFYATGSFIQPNTILHEVKMLENGSILIYDGEGILKQTFLKIKDLVEDFASKIEKKEIIEKVRDSVIDSIDKHFVSDVEVGILLSAGIDSSLIAAISSIILKKKVKTFTIGYKDKQLVNIDESKIAQATSRYYGTDHKTYYVEYTDFEESFDDFIDALDVPSYDGFNTFLISKKINKSVKVVLSGLGADELFCGYPAFKTLYKSKNLNWFELLLKHMPDKLLVAAGRNDLRYSKLKPSDLMAKFRILNQIKSDYQAQSEFTKMSNDYYLNGATVFEAENYMKNTLLRDSDAVSLFYSLEIRVPFVDKNLYNIVGGITDIYKVNKKFNKPLLSKAFEDILTPEVVNRKKTGFSLPIPAWFERYVTTNQIDADEIQEFNTLLRPNIMETEHPFTFYMTYILSKWLIKNRNHLQHI